MFLVEGRDTSLLTWRGDWVNDAMVILFAALGLNATNEGIAVSVTGTTSTEVLDALRTIASTDSNDPTTLLADAQNLLREKWDWALPRSLLCKTFAASRLDIGGARDFAKNLMP